LFKNYPDVVNVSQLQQMLGIGKNNVYKLLKENKIKHRKWGKKYIIPKIYVINYLTKTN